MTKFQYNIYLNYNIKNCGYANDCFGNEFYLPAYMLPFLYQIYQKCIVKIMRTDLLCCQVFLRCCQVFLFMVNNGIMRTKPSTILSSFCPCVNIAFNHSPILLHHPFNASLIRTVFVWHWMDFKYPLMWTYGLNLRQTSC